MAAAAERRHRSRSSVHPTYPIPTTTWRSPQSDPDPFDPLLISQVLCLLRSPSFAHRHAKLHKIRDFLGFSESETFSRQNHTPRHEFPCVSTAVKNAQAGPRHVLRQLIDGYPDQVFQLPKTRCKNLQIAFPRLFASQLVSPVKLPITEGVYETSRSVLHTEQKIDFDDKRSPAAEINSPDQALFSPETIPASRTRCSAFMPARGT